MLSRTLLTRLILSLLAIVIVFTLAIFVSRYPTVPIPVLNVAVKAGDVITDKQIAYVQLPANVIFPDLVQTSNQVVGKTAAVPISPSQPLKISEFGTPVNGGLGDGGDPHFPYANKEELDRIKLPVFPGLRQASGGLIQPGDYVNILYVADGQDPVFLYQKLHVVAARSSTGVAITAPNQVANGLLTTPTNGKASTIATYILAVCQDQALKLSGLGTDRVYYLYARKSDPPVTNLSGGNVPSGLDPCPNFVAPTPTPGIEPIPTASPAASETPLASSAPQVTPTASQSASPAAP
jgi:hypothetical protein